MNKFMLGVVTGICLLLIAQMAFDRLTADQDDDVMCAQEMEKLRGMVNKSVDNPKICP
jgi:hypothetical protein